MTPIFRRPLLRKVATHIVAFGTQNYYIGIPLLQLSWMQGGAQVWMIGGWKKSGVASACAPRRLVQITYRLPYSASYVFIKRARQALQVPSQAEKGTANTAGVYMYGIVNYIMSHLSHQEAAGARRSLRVRRLAARRSAANWRAVSVPCERCASRKRRVGAPK